jgi:hypothetical protein
MAWKRGLSIFNYQMDIYAWIKSCWTGLLTHGDNIHIRRAQTITCREFSLLKNTQTTTKITIHTINHSLSYSANISTHRQKIQI